MSVSDLHKCATEVAHEEIQREHVTEPHRSYALLIETMSNE